MRAFLCERAHAGAGGGIPSTSRTTSDPPPESHPEIATSVVKSRILSTGTAPKGGEGDEGGDAGEPSSPATAEAPAAAPAAVERGSDPLATKLRSGDACCELAISENLKIGELKRRLYSALSANGQLRLATSASALRLFKRSGARTGGLLRDAKTVRSEGL